MDKRRTGSVLSTVSFISLIFLMVLARGLGIVGGPSGVLCMGFLFVFFIFTLTLVIGLILMFTGGKPPGERYDYRTDRTRCPKCNAWIDISKAVRPCVVKCEKCNTPVLLDIEEENVKVQCPKCMTQQVQHIQSRPAEVPCMECGITLVIPKRY